MTTKVDRKIVGVACAVWMACWGEAALAQHEETLPPLSVMAGQMICIGIGEAQQLADDSPILQDIAAQQVGGVILFQKNLNPTNTAHWLRVLTQKLQSASPTPLWIGIDEEGGEVNRLSPRYGFFSMASARQMGRQNPSFTRAEAQQMAKQLRGLGINLNFAPVVDLAINPDNHVIVRRGRSFHRNPRTVSAHARAFILAHRQAGVGTVAKHFPGHGNSSGDTHEGVTDVTNSWTTQELVPYRLLIKEQVLNAVMTAHIINRRTDGTGRPATLSAATVDGMLRGQLQFSGVVFSDDLQMMAIQEQYGTKEAITLAVLAGIDVLLFSNNTVEAQQVRARDIHAMLLRLVEDNIIPARRIKEAYQRIAGVKRAQMGDW